MRKIPFSPPDISELEIQEVCEALRSGWITTGPRTKKLEQKLAQNGLSQLSNSSRRIEPSRAWHRSRR